MESSDEISTKINPEKMLCAGEISVENVQTLLYTIIEELGLSGSRYDEKRLYVEIKPGDKYEVAEQ